MQVEAIAKANDHVLCVFVNCAGPGGAAGFGTQHKIEKSLHFHQENLPSEFGLKYIPHKVLIAADGTVLKNYDFKGTSLGAEIAKLK
jgi:hypothetical protein